MQIKETFKALSVTTDGKILREYVKDIIDELGDISTVDSDPIKSRQNAIQILKVKLLDPLTEKTVREQEVDTYE